MTAAGGLGGLSASVGGTSPGDPATPADPVLTGIAAAGTEVVTGTVVYSLDADPVVAVVGGWVPWRELSTGAADGEDVAALEQALVDLGLGGDLTVDEEFTEETAEAVEQWETGLGRTDPDGVIEQDDLLVVPAGAVVTGRTAVRGSRVTGGADVLTLGGPVGQAVVDVDVEDAEAWAVGGVVRTTLPDGNSVEGLVSQLGRDVVDGRVEVRVDVAGGLEGARSGLPVVVTVDSPPTGATAVPVSAVRSDGDGGAAVLVVDDDGTQTVRVTLGVVDDGWVQVDGVPAGSRVVLPA